MGVSVYFDCSLLCSVLIIFRSIAKGNYVLPSFLMELFALMCFTYILMLSTSIFHAPNLKELTTLIQRPIKFIVITQGVYFFLRETKNYSVDKLIRDLIITASVHALIMQLQLFIPEFKMWVYNYTTTGEFRGTYDLDFRMGGVSGSTGGAVLSVVQAVSCFLTLKVTKYSLGQRVIYVLLALLLFSSILLSGRSGLLALVIMTVLNGFVVADKRYFLKLGLGLAISVPLILNLFSLIEEGSDLFYSFRRSIDFLLSKGALDQSGVMSFSEMLDFPVFPNYLIGDYNSIIHNQFGRDYESDVGYLRNINSYGLGVIFYFGISIMFLINSFKYELKIAAIICVVMMIFHFKELFLFTRMLYPIMLLLFFQEKIDYVRNRWCLYKK